MFKLFYLICTRHSELNAMNGDASEDEKRAIVSQLSTLAKLHEDVIGKITERNNNIGDRLRSWEEYRRCQDRLFAWLKEMEREKLGLNLKHVKVKEVESVLKKIQVKEKRHTTITEKN